MLKGNNTVDMCNGPLLGKIIKFTIPIILSGVLQLLYNAFDIIVVGRYSGSDSLAAVGATTSLVNLIMNFFIGIATGTSIVVAQYIGARDDNGVYEIIHTSMFLAFVSGIVAAVLGLVVSRPLLVMMDTPKEILDKSSLYLMIYFLGSPANLIYNFGSGVLKALGDTKRPLYYLIISGLANVILNYIFVLFFHMDVAGVAFATIISQYISAFLIVVCMVKSDNNCRLDLKKMKIYKDKALQILKIGLPAGMQSLVFSFSHVIIQSSVNSFGACVVAGNSAASNIEGFIYITMNAVYQACTTFVSQNYGARKFHRLNRILVLSSVIVISMSLVLGGICCLFGRQLLGMYIPNDFEAINYGMIRMFAIIPIYFLCGLMDVGSGAVRGMGESVFPAIVTIVGSCLLRIFWIYTVFAKFRTLEVLYVVFPITWFLTATVHYVTYFIIKRKKIKAVL